VIDQLAYDIMFHSVVSISTTTCPFFF